MNIEDLWHKALKDTEIIRSRVQSLNADSVTHVPYIFLSESSINSADTVVRQGELLIDKPSLLVPPLNPQFSGFDFEKDTGLSENSVINFLLVRGVTLPSLRYDNKTSRMDIFEGRLSEGIKYHLDRLQSHENVSTGLIKGPEDAWQFSLLIFVCTQILKNVNSDLRSLLRKLKDSSS